jgi:hypothetical protein
MVYSLVPFSINSDKYFFTTDLVAVKEKAREIKEKRAH